MFARKMRYLKCRVLVKNAIYYYYYYYYYCFISSNKQFTMNGCQLLRILLVKFAKQQKWKTWGEASEPAWEAKWLIIAFSSGQESTFMFFDKAAAWFSFDFGFGKDIKNIWRLFRFYLTGRWQEIVNWNWFQVCRPAIRWGYRFIVWIWRIRKRLIGLIRERWVKRDGVLFIEQPNSITKGEVFTKLY